MSANVCQYHRHHCSTACHPSRNQEKLKSIRRTTKAIGYAVMATNKAELRHANSPATQARPPLSGGGSTRSPLTKAGSRRGQLARAGSKRSLAKAGKQGSLRQLVLNTSMTVSAGGGSGSGHLASSPEVTGRAVASGGSGAGESNSDRSTKISLSGSGGKGSLWSGLVSQVEHDAGRRALSSTVGSSVQAEEPATRLKVSVKNSPFKNRRRHC